METRDVPTILVVDDQVENISLLMNYLGHFGFQIAMAQSGEEALQALAQVKPEILLLDVMMPGIDGFETCRRIKAQEMFRNVPVIFMTALSDSVEKVKGFQAGGADYITKPFQCEEVLARVNAHLSNHRLQQQLQEERARFQALTEATFEGILIHEARRIVDVNQALIELTGYQRAELLGKDMLELIAPEGRELTETTMRLGQEQPYETIGLRKDGARLPVEIQVKAMPSHDRVLSVAAMRDITWRKNMEYEQAQLRKENLTLHSTIQDRYRLGEIIGKSAAMQEVYHAIVRAAATDANVVVYGESGTGKELVAQTIHALSDRKDQQFVAVNCGAIPETLFEREFFGHRKGAFTGAMQDQPGYFDRAHNGTLFLDEVGELSPALQVKLLRVLQEREYRPLGDTVSRKVDVRVIAATNKNLKDLLQQRLIREDFFYRIRVITINLPPLRERKEDLPLLIDQFMAQYRRGAAEVRIPARVMSAIAAYHWPGNVRELQNELQRFLAEQRMEFMDSLKTVAIETDILQAAAEQTISLYQALEEFEKRFILEIFQRQQQNRTVTATQLGIDRKTLYTKLKKYGVI